MLRRLITVLAAGALALTGVVATGTAASADDGPCRACGGGSAHPPQYAEGGAGGGSITVTVTGTGVRYGGGTVDVPASSVSTPPICWYDYFLTGAEYFENWDSGEYDALMRNLPPEDHFEPYPGYEEHKDDTEGAWYSPVCSSANWPNDDLSGFFEHTSDFFAENSAVFVPAGDVPPQADVPPEVLAEIAFAEMDLPVGDIAWNPMRQGDGATFVGMDTWVWVEDALTEVSVTASVSTGTSATVRAGLDSLQVSAPGAGTVTCDGPGLPWSEGADPGAACAVVFDRSSANQPVKSGYSVPTSTMTATASWTASWTSSLDSTPTELPTQEVTSTAEVPVAEVQSLVTG